MSGDRPDADLLKLAEHHLKTRDFEGCRRRILSSPLYHPTNLTAAQILTLTHVLTRPNDYYSILSLTRFTNNPTLIQTRFKTLATLLNPNTNPLSLSSEAFSLLLHARSVLSRPESKNLYDNRLKISVPGNPNSPDSNKNGFWTVCPYCYYVYEYCYMYKDCVLRCQNEGCRKGFSAVEIRVPPPEAVAGAGRYLCLGFSPIGFKGFASWSPFSTIIEDGVGEEIEVEKVGIKRKKSVGLCAKKVMGKGVRVQRDQVDGVFGCL